MCGWEAGGILYCFGYKIRQLPKPYSRDENVTKADPGQAVGITVADCRIFHDGTVVQEQR